MQAAIVQQDPQYLSVAVDKQLNAKKEVRKQRLNRATEAAAEVKEDLPHAYP